MKKQKFIVLSVLAILLMVQPMTVHLFSKNKLKAFPKDSLIRTENKAISTTTNSFADSIMSGLKSNQQNMEFYKKIGDTNNYIKYVTRLCNDQIMRLSVDTICQRDRMFAKSFEKTVYIIAETQKLDSIRLANLLGSSQHVYSAKISNLLNNMAWGVFLRVSDKDTLQYALRWSDRSLELSPKNPAYIDTNANLLYKLEQKEKAIEKEEEALLYVDKNSVDAFKETLRKMKSGEKTWNEKIEPIGPDVQY